MEAKSKETKKKAYKVNPSIFKEGYTALIEDRLFKINTLESAAAHLNPERTQRVQIHKYIGKNKTVPEYDTQELKFEDLSDFEVYILAIAGVIERTKDVQKIIVDEGKKLNKAEE